MSDGHIMNYQLVRAVRHAPFPHQHVLALFLAVALQAARDEVHGATDKTFNPDTSPMSPTAFLDDIAAYPNTTAAAVVRALRKHFGEE